MNIKGIINRFDNDLADKIEKIEFLENELLAITFCDSPDKDYWFRATFTLIVEEDNIDIDNIECTRYYEGMEDNNLDRNILDFIYRVDCQL